MQIPRWFKTHHRPRGLVRQRVFSREKARRTVFGLESHAQRLRLHAKGSALLLPRKAKKTSLYVKKAGPACFPFVSCESVCADRGHQTRPPETPARTRTGSRGPPARTDGLPEVPRPSVLISSAWRRAGREEDASPA